MAKYTAEGYILPLCVFVIYLFLQSKSIYGGDAGDLVSASYVWGTPHPSGYPLYTLLSAIFIRLIPYSTIAWRVSLVSSIFASLSVYILYQIILNIFSKRILALIGSLLLAFCYPFFLYSAVPEVFTLSAFFILIIFYLALKLREKFSRRNFLVLFLLIGLSLTHHQMVVFIFPSLILILFSGRNKIKKYLDRKSVVGAMIFFLIGLVPFLYIPISSFFNPALEWGHPTNLKSVIETILRTRYGIFTQHFTVDTLSARWYSLVRYGQFFWTDFKIVGVFFFSLGLVELYKHKKFFWPILLGYFSYTFFLVYASVPLVSVFNLATYERFVIFSYLFLVIFIVAGIELLVNGIGKLLSIFFQNKDKRRWIGAFYILFLIYPLSSFLRNYPHINSIKNDFTAENLGRDILNSTATNSLILLANDAPIFNTQYVYFTDPDYKNHIPVHFSKLFLLEDRNNLKRQYPDIQFPQKYSSGADFLEQFLSLNAAKYNMYTNFYDSKIADSIVPNGLLWRYSLDKQPDIDAVLYANDQIWSAYQKLNPADIKFKNLFLQELLEVYSVSAQNLAYYYMDNKQYDAANKYLSLASYLRPQDGDIFFLQGILSFKNGLCQEAEDNFLDYIKHPPYDLKVYDSLIDLSTDCWQSRDKEEYYSELKKKELEKLSPRVENF